MVRRVVLSKDPVLILSNIVDEQSLNRATHQPHQPPNLRKHPLPLPFHNQPRPVSGPKPMATPRHLRHSVVHFSPWESGDRQRLGLLLLLSRSSAAASRNSCPHLLRYQEIVKDPRFTSPPRPRNKRLRFTICHGKPLQWRNVNARSDHSLRCPHILTHRPERTISLDRR